MATLKGQNFRIGIEDNGDYYVVAMASNCVVTLTNNVEDASTKDDVGMASKPTVNSQSWSVQVDSLSVADVGALLTAMKSMQPLSLMFDETSTADNFTAQHATFARKGTAYLNDATFTFNDRENSAKNLQLTGASPLQSVSSGDVFLGPAASAYTKGQFVRLFLSNNNTAVPSAVIGYAKQLSLHVSLSLEDATTKDTSGTFQVQEPTSLSYDISSTALIRGNDSITSTVTAQDLASLETIHQAGTPVKWLIANTSGDNNRTKGSVIASGSCIIQTLTMTAQNKQSASYQASLTGFGPYSVGS